MAEEQYHSIPRSVLAVGLGLAFAMWAPLLTVPPIESVLVEELGISHTLASLLYSGPVVVLALAAIPAGLLADTIGLKRTVGAGALVIAAGAVLRGVSDSYPVIMLFTLVYGLGLALSFPNLPKLARHCSPRDRSHVTLGMFSVAILLSGGLSLAITRPLIYELTHSFQAVFYIWSAPAIVAAALWWLFVKDPPCESSGVETARFDLMALRRLVWRRDLWTIAALFFLHNIFFYTWAGWMPEYLLTIGAAPNLAGLIASVTLWIGIPSVVFFTELSSRLGTRKPFLWAPSVLLALAALAALFINVPASWALMAVAGASTTVRFVITIGLPVEMAPSGQGGAASGFVMSVGYIGALIGPVMAGTILDTAGNYDLVFLVLVAVSALTVGVALMAPETGRGRKARA